jgi:NitT/TauT family transport system substrate-binding protein
MKRLLLMLTAVLFLVGCGQSYEEKRRISRHQRLQMLREDSAALKIAVMPTLDCLPLFVAKETHLFDTLGADVRLKMFTAQMDCDTALVGGSVEGAVTDIVRAERLMQQGTPLDYLTTTNAYWQLYTNRTARIKALKQLDDKMVAMTRYSTTDLLADYLRDSVKIDQERLFKIQVNDVNIRLKMLLNSEIDAVLLTEPQATQARVARHNLLFDTRNAGMLPGVMVCRQKIMKDNTRMKQVEVLRKGYNMACDSLARYGIGHYRHLLERYCKLKSSEVDSLPRNLKFHRIAEPLQADVERARKWLKQ